MISNKTNFFVYELFEKQVKKAPEAIAVEFGKNQLTYRELNQTSGKVALELIESGFRTGDMAAIEFHSPFEMTSGILGILKAGGGYLPINHRYPREYIQNILQHSKVNYYLKSSSCEDKVEFQGKTLVYNSRERNDQDAWNPGIKNHLGNPLTVIYGSNSSGKPEGMSLSHEKILKWIRFNLEKLRIDFSKTLFISSLRIEVSFPLWLGNLTTGGNVYFYDPKDKNSLSELLALMVEKDFTSVICPLSFLEILVNLNDYKDFFTGNIRNIVSVGEDTFRFNITGFKEFLKSRKIPVRWHNYYGFPGINVITTLVEDEFTNKDYFIHTGRPASETRAYILNKTMQLVSIGKIGELYLAGSGIMDMYYQNEGLNRTHFIKNDNIPDPIIYKTGYKAYWLPDGKLSLLGRTDNLVNINGNPVALEEVEAALFRHHLINDCAVTVRKGNGERLRLVAYLVLREEVDEKSLEEFLKNILPDEYFPIGFVRLLSIPRTPDGLVDRKYLGQLERFDSLRVQSLEKKIGEFPQIEQAAVRVKEKTERPVPFHLKKYLPGLRSVSSGKIKESFETSIQPGLELESTEPAIIHGDELVWEEGDPRTLAEALKRAAARHGDNGVRFIRADGSEHFQSYSSLLEEAEQVLAGLRKLGLKPKDKVLFQFDRNEDFVSAFWGCMLGGVVPVPLMVPKSFARASNETETLKRVWELLDKPVILTNIDAAESIRSFSGDFQVEEIEQLRENEADKNGHKSSPEDVAIVLFTSGSTGKPKGVLQCHRSILSREKSTTLYNGGTHNDVSINWMPLAHVGGIVMFHLNDVYMGCQQIQVSTEYILTDPLRWLDIISMYRGTITWAPNFAYALVSERVEKKRDGDWDLSSMRFILNGGEAINAASSGKFLKLLAPFGLAGDAMKPAWGMSETCSGVVYSHLLTAEPGTGVHYLDKHVLSSGVAKKNSSAADAVTFVELGKTIPGMSIRIVDSKNQVVKEGIIGHLQVKGPTVTSGYYKNPELDKEVFSSDGWFDTGDLAVILNGRMTITGRAKDVIIVHGINLNSGEIEAAVEEVEGVETSFTAACAVRDETSDTDRVVVFYHSIYRDFKRKLNQVKQIQKKFGEKFGLNLDYVIPLAKEDIPKTSIGKIQRLKLARSFQEGAFDDIVKQVDIGLENENTLPLWFFKKCWRNHAVRLYDEPRKDVLQTCLVFDEGSGLSETLVDRLEKENCRCIKVNSGGEFKPLDDSSYQIDYRDAGDYRRLIGAIEKSNLTIGDIFFLYGCSEFKGKPIDIDVMKDIHARGVYSLLYLIQALESGSVHLKRMFVVTSNAQSVLENDRIAYEECSISGFLKSLSLELDWLHCCHVDLDIDSEAGNKDNTVECLVKEWKNPRAAGEVAYRKGRRLEPFLARLDIEKEETRDLPIKTGGIYLVTGGLGGIGIYVCHWLMENFAAKLIVVGRTSLPERNRWSDILDEKSVVSKRIRAYLDLEASASGGEFIYAAGDAADSSFLSQVVDRAESKWQDSLAGVLHLAGYGNLEYHWTVMDKHWVVKETPQTYEEMFQAKVYGTLALHRLLEDHKEAIFVAFSSTTSFFGAATFSAYSAANSFLDGFCLYRKSNGWPNTYCLNWSSWDDVGMSENNPGPMVTAMLANGYEMIPPRQGISSMLVGLRLNPQQLFIGLNGSSRHIRTFMADYPSVKQIVSVYYTTKNKMGIDEPAPGKSILQMISSPGKNSHAELKMHPIEKMPLIDGSFIDYKQLEQLGDHLPGAALEDELPQTEIEQKLASIWRDILGKTHIGINDNFFELGGHSLNATVLASRIHKVFDVKIPLVDFFRIPTIRELAQYISETAASMYAAIEPLEKKEYYALSSAQERLFILQQIELESIAYNMPQVHPLPGELDIQRLESTFLKLIQRHEILRTCFYMIDRKPVQKVHDEVKFEIEYSRNLLQGVMDVLPGMPEERAGLENFIHPFDLSHAPLLRVGVVETDEHKHLLMVDMHHIISDGVSHGILAGDFITLYGGETLPPLRIHYKDFAQWQNSEKEKDYQGQQEAYWLKVFGDEIPVLNIPTDYSRPAVQSFEGGVVHFEISVDRAEKLRTIALKEETTLYMVLLALCNVLFYKLSGQEDIVVGTPMAGRRHADLEKIIGMFVNTLAIRNYPNGEKTFRGFLKELKKRTMESFENQEYQFEDLVDKVAVNRDASRNPIFDVMFTLQNFESSGEGRSERESPDAGKIDNNRIDKKTQDGYLMNISKFDITLFAVESDKKLSFYVEYCTKLFRKETIEQFIGYFKNIISLVVKEPDIKLCQIGIISEEEKKRILYDFNNKEAEYPKDKTIHQLFEEESEKRPDHAAVIFEDQIITYKELNRRADLLSAFLYSKGVNKEDIVGIMVEHCQEMMIGILAILKTGGCYLPVNMDYPEIRKRYVLKESNARILLVNEKKREYDDIMVVDLQDPFVFTGEAKVGKNQKHPFNDLAYIMYTSGSTGKPKGVMVEHRSVIRLVRNTNYIEFNKNDRVLQTGALEFDASTFEIWGALLNGLTLCLVGMKKILAADQLKGTIEKYDISTMWMTAPLFNQMLEINIGIFSGLRNFLVGGDVLSPFHIDQLKMRFPGLKVINGYGPTENTTFSTTYLIDKKYKENIPIGKPIANSFAYIFDKYLNMQPFNIPGELCMGGDGVARGYLNSPELTKQRFVENPFIPPGNMYKTGDLACWQPDGNIKFIGRIDQQHKIRGYRVELEEIESRLSKHEKIKNAVVIAKENEKGEKYLCAYIISDKEFEISGLREYLSRELPDYMIPVHFVQLKEFPLTVNGKIDRKALPSPRGIDLGSHSEYAAPGNEIEKKLVESWEQVLGTGKIGVNDNFFEIGGDSIKTIQISARMNEKGYKVEMKDIFQYPTISELAPFIKKSDRIAIQSAITGKVPLTPIQKRFFGKYKIDPHHFNQAVIFYSEEEFEEAALEAIFKKLQEHHDALRMIYKEENGDIIQINRGLDSPFSLQVFDYRNRKDATSALEVKVNETQASINLETGPLMKLSLFHLDDGDRLLIVIHHLVVDAVSWRILFEDIRTLYLKYRNGEKLELPLKTDSFKIWAEKLVEYANSKSFLEEKAYWAELESHAIEPVKKDFEEESNDVKDTERVSFTLSITETELLLTKANEAFGTEANELLITALGMGIKKAFAIEKILIALEGHGREEILNDVNIKRTVGWFTSVYPVLLDCSSEYSGEDVSRQIKYTKETLRRVPNRGFGYGVLKYLAAEEQRKEVNFKLNPQIGFNYLGQFDTDVEQMSFGIAKESPGNIVSLNEQREIEIDVSGMIANKRLVASIAFNNKQYKSETINILLDHYNIELRRIISYCANRKDRKFTPSDFTYKGLSIEMVDQLSVQYALKDIYLLSPMQEGMLFFALYEKNSSVYFEQTSYRLYGELDVSLVEKSLNELFKRHDILRTVFLSKGLDHPVQVVLKDRQVDFFYKDIRKIIESTGEEKEKFIKEFREKDRQRSFDLSRDVLMRVAVLQIGSTEYEFTWSFHHILMDGWCIGILVSEFFEIYNSYLGSRKCRLEPVQPYRAFIEWLETQNREKSRNFWRKYLEGYKEAVHIKKIKMYETADSRYKKEEVTFTFDEKKSQGLNELASRNQVTLSSIFRLVWGIILARYTGKQDVVFGAVVSGRPAEIEGVESMVGLFINTIPVRLRIVTEEKITFKELLRKVQKDAIDSEPHHYYPLARIQAENVLKQDLLDHILVFENYPTEKRMDGLMKSDEKSSEEVKLKVSNVEIFEQSSYDFNVIIGDKEKLNLRFLYNGNLFNREFVEKISGHFFKIVDQILNDDQIEVCKLEILGEKEISRLIKMIRNENDKSFIEENIERNKDSVENLEANFDF